MTPVISVIVPALNEERALPMCLEALIAQTLANGAFEVIVVDNGSVDRTLAIARSFESRLNLRVAEKRACSIAALRNLGVQLAQGDLLAFLDADCVAQPNWLAFAVQILEEAGPGVFGAGYQIPSDSRWVARAWYGSQHSKSGRVSYISGGNLIVSRAAFVTAGGFDEDMQTSEDWEFCQRAARRGLATRAFPQLAVTHLGTPQTLREFYVKQYWHGTHALKAMIHSSQGLSSGRAAWFALWTLLTMGAFLAGLAGTPIAGNALPAAAGSVCLLAAPIFLALRTALARSKMLLVLPLITLYLTYGVARALCLAGMRAPRPAKPVLKDSLVG